jgi:hypothetical protein
MNNSEQLRKVLDDYKTPDPNIVGKLPRGGIQLDFVGHADITKLLIEIDPLWSWEPVAIVDGRPAIHVVNGMAVMWGRLTILGKSMLGVGTVKHDKPDLDKELIGDFLRNASMRFGICLSLWTKQEWEEPNKVAGKAQGMKGLAGTHTTGKQTQVPASSPVISDDDPISDEQRAQFVAACEKAGLDPANVAKNAKVTWEGVILQRHLPHLRSSFNDLKSFAAGE